MAEFVETVLEQSSLLEMGDMGLSALKFVELFTQSVENTSHTRMIGQHHSTNFVWRGNVGALLSESDLD